MPDLAYHCDLNVTFSAVGQPFSRGWLSVVAASVGGMDSSSFPATAQVRQTHPGALAVLLSTLSPDAVAAMSGAQAESVVVATQRVASWAHGLQAVAVDRFAEHVLDDQEAHATGWSRSGTRSARRSRPPAGRGVAGRARSRCPNRSRSRRACWRRCCGSARAPCARA